MYTSSKARHCNFIDVNLHHENHTYVFESVCELLQASFLNFTIENNEKTENGRKKYYTSNIWIIMMVAPYQYFILNSYLLLPPLSISVSFAKDWDFSFWNKCVPCWAVAAQYWFTTKMKKKGQNKTIFKDLNFSGLCEENEITDR